jgi:uncharacterized protein YlxW (UPF0749 family)
MIFELLFILIFLSSVIALVVAAVQAVRGRSRSAKRILGVLVVTQLRAQAGNPGLAQLSTQDLTVLVANLNAHNDQLRSESSALEQELATLTANQSRGDASVDEISADLERIRAYAGLEPVGGPGVMISVQGPIDGASRSCSTAAQRRRRGIATADVGSSPGSWRPARRGEMPRGPRLGATWGIDASALRQAHRR